MFALPKHIADELAIKSHYILQKISTNFDKRQFKSNQTKNTKIYQEILKKFKRLKMQKFAILKIKLIPLTLATMQKTSKLQGRLTDH